MSVDVSITSPLQRLTREQQLIEIVHQWFHIAAAKRPAEQNTAWT